MKSIKLIKLNQCITKTIIAGMIFYVFVVIALANDVDVSIHLLKLLTSFLLFIGLACFIFQIIFMIVCDISMRPQLVKLAIVYILVLLTFFAALGYIN